MYTNSMSKPFWIKPVIQDYTNNTRVNWVSKVEAPINPEDFVYSFYIDSDEIIPEVEALDAGLVAWVGPYPYFPFIHDYVNLIPDDNFTDGLTLTTPANERPLFLADSRNRPRYEGVATDSTLNISGAFTLRVAFRVENTVGSDVELIGYGGNSELESSNYPYLLRATSSDEGRLFFLTETGAGVNHSADWRLPMGRWVVGESYIAEVKKSSGDVAKVYINGQQLAWVSGLVNATDDGDGAVSGLSHTGDGSTSVLSLGEESAVDDVNQYYWAIYDTEKADSSTYPAGKIASTLQIYQPDADLHSTLAEEAGTVLCLSSADGTVTDLAGNLTGWAVPAPTSQDLIVGKGWTIGDGEGSTADPEFQVLGDLVIRAKFRYGGGSLASLDTVVACSESGETLPTNALYWLYFESSTVMGYAHEYGAGTNAIAEFDIPEALEFGQIIYVVVRRTDNGDGTHDVEMWMQQESSGTFSQMTLSSTTGTDNGDDTATILEPEDGSSGVLSVFNLNGATRELEDAMMDVVHIKAATTDDSTENAIAALLMPTT